MIKLLNKIIERIMLGKMGIKRVLQGKKEIYTRPGGYFYLEFDSNYGI